MTDPDVNPSPPSAAAQVGGATAAAAAPPTIIIQQKDGRVSRWFSWMGWIILLASLPFVIGLIAQQAEYADTTGGVHERFHSGQLSAKQKIAIIDVGGLIMEGDGFVKKQINRISDDSSVVGVVVRINSPGGTVTGSDYIYHHLTNLREDRSLPMVVSMGSVAASGGYYIAMAVGDQEDAIFAEPTTTTGSIGVIIPHYDLSGFLEQWDVKDDSIVSHPRKQLLSMTRPPSPEDRQILQDYVNQSFSRFKDIVLSGRPYFLEHQEELDELATGEIFTAGVAKERRLVDRIGFVEDAIDRVAELAGVDAQQVRVITYKKPLTVLEALGAVQSNNYDLERSLLSLAVPRAYYLFTTLPPLLSSRTR